MMEALLLSVLIGLLRRGSLRAFARIELQGTEWIFFGALLQYGSIALAARGVPWFVANGGNVFVVSFIPLLYGVWRCRHLPGLSVVGLGLILNMLVIGVNGGRMPVSAAMAEWAGLSGVQKSLETSEHLRHTLMDETTRLPLLGDVIPIPKPLPRPGVASIGDVLIVVGLFIFIQRTMVGRGRHRESAS